MDELIERIVTQQVAREEKRKKVAAQGKGAGKKAKTETDEERGKRARRTAIAGAKGKALKGLVGGMASGSGGCDCSSHPIPSP